MGMTQQYLAGEMSLLLAQMQATTTDQSSARRLACLRHEAETGPVSALPSVAVRALELTDGLCWYSLSQGDTAAFTRQAAAAADLCEFGVCAGLLAQT